MSAPKFTSGHPPVIGTVHESYACGCKLEGVGNLRDPWRVVYCPKHAAAPDLYAALAEVLRILATEDNDGLYDGGAGTDARLAAQDALAKARGEV